jgi:hypothetical protein
MKLKIGDCEIPERCLRNVILYNQDSSVSFSGVLYGEQRVLTKTELNRSASMSPTLYEAVDKNGVSATGLCSVKNLKFEPGAAAIIKFSGQLVRPFQQD